MGSACHYSVAIEGSPEVFTINTRYRIVRKVGSGSYGTVCSAYDQRDNSYCAIKKVYRVFEKRLFTKRCLREIKLLKHLNHHPRIINLLDIDIVDPQNFNEIYLVFDCMDASLHDVIHSEKPISTVQCQWILYQMLSGLKYMHSAQIIHRDLKPANILVNRDCNIKICDFGMARGYQRTSSPGEVGFMTEYVTTRWYRAPEIMLSPKSYSEPIDVWSVGCIFGEMLSGKVLFKGRNYVDQIHKILGILGLPLDITFWEPSKAVIAYLEQLCTADGQPPPRDPINFNHLFPHCPNEGIDLLESLLQLNPARRITVTEALGHPFIIPFGDPEEEMLQPPSPCDFQFEQCDDQAELRCMIVEEVRSFHLGQWELERGVRSTPVNYETKRNSQDYPCRATMSLLDQTAAAAAAAAARARVSVSAEEESGCGETEADFMSTGLVSEPQEMTDKEHHHLFEAQTGGVIVADPHRRFSSPAEGPHRDCLERELSGMW